MAKNLIICILSVALVISLYFNFRESQSNFRESPQSTQYLTKPGPNFRKPVKDSHFHHYIDSFRLIYKPDITHGVYYDTADIRYYLDKIYPSLIERMTEKPGYSWKVGFYFIRNPDKNGTLRLNFLVAPLLVKADSVIDFHNHPEVYKMTERPSPKTTPPDCMDCVGYDAGQLWP